jgi:hypothetical protein
VLRSKNECQFSCPSKVTWIVPKTAYSFEDKKVKVKMPLCLKKYYAMKTHGGVDISFHIFSTSALDASGQRHALAALPPKKEPSPVRIGQETG